MRTAILALAERLLGTPLVAPLLPTCPTCHREIPVGPIDEHAVAARCSWCPSLVTHWVWDGPIPALIRCGR